MKSNIELTRVSRSDFSPEQYGEHITHLILEAQSDDPTIVLHSHDEIIKRFSASVVAIMDGRIIWNTSLYPTHMKPFNTLSYQGRDISMGECGTTVVEKWIRMKGIGRALVEKALEEFWCLYDGIVTGTVNERMVRLRESLGFREIPFPKELYEEWKKFLSPKMVGWKEEFKERAKCMFLQRNITKEEFDYILSVLSE